MKTQRLIIALVALTFAFAPQSLTTASADRNGQYRAELISPTAGQVLVPGQIVRISWTSTLPHMDLSWCETELRLSLDGGRTFTWITGERDPRVKYFDWIVPNTPTNAGVLDIHFGCLGYYPETQSLQVQSPFVIISRGGN
jgi:hypothetical protein